MEKSVCFSGYRPTKFNYTAENKKLIYQKLIIEIGACIKYGYNSFYFGGAPGFDLLAAFALIYLKKAFDIKLICALPYENFYLSDEFDEAWRRDYQAIINKCDEIINVSGAREKTGDCFGARNKFMVDNSDILICFSDGKPGGTKNTIGYACQKGLKIINLLPM